MFIFLSKITEISKLYYRLISIFARRRLVEFRSVCFCFSAICITSSCNAVLVAAWHSSSFSNFAKLSVDNSGIQAMEVKYARA